MQPYLWQFPAIYWSVLHHLSRSWKLNLRGGHILNHMITLNLNLLSGVYFGAFFELDVRAGFQTEIYCFFYRCSFINFWRWNCWSWALFVLYLLLDFELSGFWIECRICLQLLGLFSYLIRSWWWPISDLGASRGNLIPYQEPEVVWSNSGSRSFWIRFWI